MIDWDTLVIVPNQDIFSRPAMLTPLVSQPGSPPYAARGIFQSTPIDVIAEGGGIFSDQKTTYGIRYADYTVAPLAHDRLDIPGVGTFDIQDVDDDGQGGAKLLLRRVT